MQLHASSFRPFPGGFTETGFAATRGTGRAGAGRRAVHNPLVAQADHELSDDEEELPGAGPALPPPPPRPGDKSASAKSARATAHEAKLPPPMSNDR